MTSELRRIFLEYAKVRSPHGEEDHNTIFEGFSV